MHLAPTSGAPGATVTATGYGFGANESVALRWNAPTRPLLATGTSNSLDTFAGSSAPTFKVPASAAVTYTVYGIGQNSGAQALASFTIPQQQVPL